MRSNTHKRSPIRQHWHGSTLLILALLFLAAPNALADNPSVGCPLTTVNVAADTCFIVTAPVGSVTIDGVRTGAEWTGAIQKNIAGPPGAIIRFRRNGANLVFLISVNDTSNNTSDTIQLSFDPLHNHGTTSDDVTFTIRREGAGHQRTDNGGTAPWVPGANLVTCTDTCTTPDFVNGWQAEVVITPADLEIPNVSPIVGFNLTVSNQDTADISSWPEPAAPDAATWANIKTRFPIELLMVLDQSGSMLSFDRWNSAKRAANLMANTLFALKDTNFQDKLGMVTFKSDCTTHLDTTSLPKPLLDLPGAFPGDYLSGTADPLSNNCTPIGKGLDKAFEGGAGTLLVNSQPNKEAERIVLLLSDGFHNSPPANVQLVPSHLVYDPCEGTNGWDLCPGNTVHRVRVNTVALGSDASVDTALLTNIKNRFAGFGATYNIADVGETGLLMDHFIGTLDDLFQVNALPPGSPFTVNTLERKLIVIVTWGTPADAGAITLTRDGNPVVCNTSNFNVTAGHSICIVNNPQQGSYTATTANPSERQFNLVDLHLAASFAIDKQLHGTGQDLVLTARLNEGGVPATNTGAHPVNVTVNIKRPTEGFGTYVSTHESTNCAGGPPQLPPVRQDPTTGAGVSLPIIPPLLVATSGNEPKPARFAKIDDLFTKCSKSSLTFIEEPGTPMFDDGTHGDVTANDGIYTLRIQDAQTQFEGSYSFRFRASGKSPSGSDFARVKTLGEYVRVNVDPSSTPIGFRVLQQTGTIITREYHITPRDRFGGYLGPGHSDQITFTTTAGTFVTPVIDYNNGIYSRVLRFDSATENPVVGGTVQGSPLNPTTGGFGSQGFEFFPYLGGSVYDNSLGLNNGFTLGARFGYRFPNQFALEAEGGVTFTRFNFGPNVGQRAKLIQVLGNVRYDIDQWGSGNWTPYVIAGAGGVVLRGAGVNDSAFAAHAGFGSTWRLTNHVGIRADGRVFRFGNLNGAPSTTSFQGNVGVVFRF